MKIAIFSDCYLDLTGGIVTAINAEKQELERRGHTVYVFSSAYPRSKAETARLAKQHIFPVPSCRFWFRGLTPIARRPQIIERWLDQTHPELADFDIIYVHYEAGCSIAGLRYAKKHHIPAVQVMHGREDVGEAALIPRGLRTFVAWNLNWFHSWYLPHSVRVHRDNYLATTHAKAAMWSLMVNHAMQADLVLTATEHFTKKLTHYGLTRRIIVLPHGLPDYLCDTPIQPKVFPSILGKTPGNSPDSPVIPGKTSAASESSSVSEPPATPKTHSVSGHSRPLEIIWHSRVSPEKRILAFLKALTMVTGPYHLTVYGNGPDLAKAQKYAHRHHLNVTFRGLAPAPTVYRAIQKSHLDVLISYNYDTFGMTLIEAAAFGTPVLVADSDLTEILPRSSYLLARDPSPAAIAEQLNSLFAHPDSLARMSKAMLSARPRLKISRKIDKLERIFTSLCPKSTKNRENPTQNPKSVI